MVGSHRQGSPDDGAGRVLALPDRSRPAAPRFPGFEEMVFSVRTRWEYGWRETRISNGEAKPVDSGVVRMALSDPMEVDFGPAGLVSMFEAAASAKSGSVPDWWPQWRYLGVKDGALYAAAEIEGGEYAATLLFDPRTGAVHAQGFMGWFSGSARSVSLGSISGSFLAGPAVVVDEPSFDPGCETIGGVQICEGERHDYSVREYYLPGRGFGGWYRRGTSIYAGGGSVDVFESTLEVGLKSTTL